MPPFIEFFQIVERKGVSIVSISGSVRLLRVLRELLGLRWLLVGLLLLETDRKRRDRIFDLDRELGLALHGLGRDGLLLLLLVVLGEMLRMRDGVEGLLDWRVKRDVPKTEMLETHANTIQISQVFPFFFPPDVVFPEIKCVVADLSAYLG